LSIIQSSIQDTTDRLEEAIDKGELDKAKTLRDELVFLTGEQQKYRDLDDKNIDSLQKALSGIKERLADIDMVVSAPVSGIVSFNIDGFENFLTLKNMNELSFETVGIKKADKAAPPAKASSGGSILKIVDNFTWYLALKTPKDLQKGWYYNIQSDETGGRVKAKLTDVYEDTGIGVFHVGVDLKELIDSRKIAIRLITKVYNGLLIPDSAIFDKEGVRGVYIMTSGKKVFKPLKIIFEYDGKAIVEGVKLGDKLLLNKRDAVWIR